MVLKYQDWLKIYEGGQTAGSMQLVDVTLAEARAYANDLFEKNQHLSLDQVLPNFDQNFNFAQSLAKEGSTQRKDMPVIEQKDVKAIQSRLKSGDLDVRAPFAKGDGDSAESFPEGLTGEDAKQWLKDGLPKYDKAGVKDDVVKCKDVKVAAKDLVPIQKQIYLSKCLEASSQRSIKEDTKFLENTYLIISSDNHIIDGHHRWMSAILIDPKIRMKALQIDLPIKTLLPLATAFGDAVGNERNA